MTQRSGLATKIQLIKSSNMEALDVTIDAEGSTLLIDETSYISTDGTSSHETGSDAYSGASYASEGGDCNSRPRNSKKNKDKMYGDYKKMPNVKRLSSKGSKD